MPTSIALITCIPTHHQIPVGQSFHDILGDRFRMIFTNPLDQERSRLGWTDSDRSEWIVRAWEPGPGREQARQCLNDADVVIYGAVPTDLVRDRILSGKITFRYSERLFKHGFVPGFAWWFRRLARDFWPLDLPNHHLLAAGAYCAKDHRRVRMFEQRSWKWGYFTNVADSPPPARPPRGPRIIWAGRMLNLKKVHLILKAIHRLSRSHSNFSVDLIGDGPEKGRLIALSERYGLQNFVRFIPSMPYAEVLKAMEQADIYIFPSNFLEGWGAVINEAMAAGCCVVSSTGPGAAPWLIRHGETGYLFPSGDLSALCQILENLMRVPATAARIGGSAWQTMETEWSPKIAASRLLALSLGLLGKGPMPQFASGPCSPCD